MTNLLKCFWVTGLAAIALSISGCADANSADQSKTERPMASAVAASVESSATSWEIVPDNSHLRFSALQEGEAFTGKFERFSGRIQFDPETPETGVVDISIPLNSVDAGSNDRNSTLPGKIWFSVKAFPEARFTSGEILKQERGFLAKGELTLKGKTLPIDLPFELSIDGDRAVMTGAAQMDRTQWEVGASPWDTDEWVSRTVTLDIQVTANRAK